MKYYLHDTNSFQDEKISELFIKYGYEGLGLFYTILERLAAQEKPIKTDVLKRQLKVGRKLEKCWEFMESLGIISSTNGETFNKQLANYVETFRKKREKTKNKVSEWRDNQEVIESVTGYSSVTEQSVTTLNVSNIKVSKDKEVIANAIVGEMPTAGETLKVQKELFENIARTKASLIGFIQKEQPKFIEPYVELWNIWAKERGKAIVKDITDRRRKHFKVRINEPIWDFVKILTKASKSDKCLTEGWFGFDFIIESRDKYLKLLEGNYDNKDQQKAAAELTETEKKFLSARDKA